ncbi:OmpA family protein [Sphingomicrobium astaxanthinifaciens]|uniref:OmpA family protein n=1 Tax=Sphingomicrobium astaxanthinifaciens TaxID=1227949 RepID=UPI001FCAEB24|nr:OmpA family protein [Sphingomicrobium astaxanthinifaciens]MCJ7421393.1 OmpA family protein [Sphingomicrobium astaxanthinifaciens]
MKLTHKITAVAVVAGLGTAACTTDAMTGERRISTEAAIGTGAGAVLGYLLGDIIGGRNDRTAKIIGAGVGAVAGGAVGAYMDKQEQDMRRATAGTGVDVIRDGDELLLRMPSSVTFPVDSYTIQPEFRATLDEVARTLSTYDSTYIDIMGHTDSTGRDDYNQRLSVNRANAVADYLAARGVQRARMATVGYGETQPIADNSTEYGRAQNRRVEIKVVPVTQQDVNAAGY